MDVTKYVARILPVFRAIFVHPLGSGCFLAHAISKFYTKAILPAFERILHGACAAG